MVKPIVWTAEMLKVVDDYVLKGISGADAAKRSGVSRQVISNKAQKVYGDKAKNRHPAKRSENRTENKRDGYLNRSEITPDTINRSGKPDHFDHYFSEAMKKHVFHDR